MLGLLANDHTDGGALVSDRPYGSWLKNAKSPASTGVPTAMTARNPQRPGSANAWKSASKARTLDEAISELIARKKRDGRGGILAPWRKKRGK